MTHILSDHVVKASMSCLRTIALQRLQSARSRFGERVGELCEPSAPTGDGDHLRVEEFCEHGWHGVCRGEAVAHHKYGEAHRTPSLGCGLGNEEARCKQGGGPCEYTGDGHRRRKGEDQGVVRVLHSIAGDLVGEALVQGID